jgi:hypothetical protein
MNASTGTASSFLADYPLVMNNSLSLAGTPQKAVALASRTARSTRGFRRFGGCFSRDSGHHWAQEPEKGGRGEGFVLCVIGLV